MKKVKNSELKVNNILSKPVKEGKIKKKTLKNDKKFHGTASKTYAKKLAPEGKISESKLYNINVQTGKKQIKYKTSKEEAKQQFKKDDHTVVTNGNNTKQEMVTNQDDNPQNKLHTETPAKELTDLTKIEKKLAQQLKKKQKRSEFKSLNKTLISNINNEAKKLDTDVSNPQNNIQTETPTKEVTNLKKIEKKIAKKLDRKLKKKQKSEFKRVSKTNDDNTNNEPKTPATDVTNSQNNLHTENPSKNLIELKKISKKLSQQFEQKQKKSEIESLNKTHDANTYNEPKELAIDFTNPQNKLQTETPSKEITQNKKISKKLAWQLKKKQNRLAFRSENKTNAANTNKEPKKATTDVSNTQSNHHTETPSKKLTELKEISKKFSQQFEKKQKSAIKSLNKTHDSNTYNEPKELAAADSKKLDSVANKVLKKKEKNAEERKKIKDQKLAEKQIRDPAVAASTVFVGNLPVNIKRVQLLKLFKKFGPVTNIRLRTAGGKCLYKHKQRKTAGSLNAYVVLTSIEKAEKALSLNGMEFKDNHLRVTAAPNKSESVEKENAKRTIFVGNLKYSATEESLREIFSTCGEINYIRCLRDGDKGCKGVAYICFKGADAVALAMELNQTVVDERPIRVERFSVKKLGAKEERETLAKQQDKSKIGTNKRMDGKKETSKVDTAKKAKKSEFRGLKVDSLKKKQKSKKKKSNDQMLQLAKKIAPKLKTI